MTRAEEGPAPVFVRGDGLFLIVAGAIAASAGLGALFLSAVTDMPMWVAVLAPLAVFLGAAVVWRTYWGICFASFAIVPLGFLDYEVGGVTLGVPEVLILLLFFKEAVRFVARRERLVAFLPRWSLLGYLAGSAVAFMTGLLRGNGFVRGLQDLRQFNEFVVLYLLVLHRVATPRQVRIVLAWFVFGCVLVGVHGILQSLTGMGIPATQLVSDAVYIGGIRGGSFYGPTPLGGIMVLASGAALALIVGSRSRAIQLAFAGCLVVCIAAAVTTHTRASWLALFVTIAFVFLLVKKTPLRIVAAVIGAVAFAAVFGPTVVERLGSLSFSKAEQSLRQRVQYYTAAWHIFRDHPLFGLGWGCEYDVNTILANERYVPTRDYSEKFSSEKSTVHSAYLQMLVKAGLLGLGAFLWFLGSWVNLVRRVRRARPRDEVLFGLFAGVTGGVMGYLFHSAGENFFQWPTMSQAFYLLLGCSTVAGVLVINRAAATPAEAGRKEEPAEAG